MRPHDDAQPGPKDPLAPPPEHRSAGGRYRADSRSNPATSRFLPPGYQDEDAVAAPQGLAAREGVRLPGPVPARPMKRRKRNLLAVLFGFAVVGALLLAYTLSVNQQTSTDDTAGDDSSVSSPDATVEAADADPETTGTEQPDAGAQGTTTEQPATTASATDETVGVEASDPPPGPPPVRAVLADDQVVIEGEVASQEAADTLVELMEPLAGPGGVVSELVVNPAAPEADGVSIVVADEVVFPPGSDEVSPQFFPTLDQMVAVMQLSPEITVVVEGHTDSDGNEVDNLALSQRRAEAVVDYIAANSVNRFRLEPRGRGSGEPIDDNATDEGRRRNRRIEFEVNGFDLSL